MMKDRTFEIKTYMFYREVKALLSQQNAIC